MAQKNGTPEVIAKKRNALIEALRDDRVDVAALAQENLHAIMLIVVHWQGVEEAAGRDAIYLQGISPDNLATL